MSRATVYSVNTFRQCLNNNWKTAFQSLLLNAQEITASYKPPGDTLKQILKVVIVIQISSGALQRVLGKLC